MTLPLLIAGIILLVGGDWFDGQQAVGWVLTAFGTIGLFLQFVVFGVIFSAASKRSRF